MSEQQTTHGEAMSQPLAPYLPEEENQKRSCIFYKLIVPSILHDKKLVPVYFHFLLCYFPFDILFVCPEI